MKPWIFLHAPSEYTVYRRDISGRGDGKETSQGLAAETAGTHLEQAIGINLEVIVAEDMDGRGNNRSGGLLPIMQTSTDLEAESRYSGLAMSYYSDVIMS